MVHQANPIARCLPAMRVHIPWCTGLTLLFNDALQLVGGGGCTGPQPCPFPCTDLSVQGPSPSLPQPSTDLTIEAVTPPPEQTSLYRPPQTPTPVHLTTQHSPPPPSFCIMGNDQPVLVTREWCTSYLTIVCFLFTDGLGKKLLQSNFKMTISSVSFPCIGFGCKQGFYKVELIILRF